MEELKIKTVVRDAYTGVVKNGTGCCGGTVSSRAHARSCGYSDAAAFRRLFQRIAGMSMSDYRARFALRARRRYWRMEDAAARRGMPG